MKKIKVEEVNEMLKNMLTLEQYIELLQLMIKECESFMDNNKRCSIGLDKYTPYTKEQKKIFLKFINGSRYNPWESKRFKMGSRCK